MRHTLSSGFTLIEISIVLVIIGLLAGSVYVRPGSDNLCRAPRATPQIDKYNSGVHAFENKYGGLPGI